MHLVYQAGTEQEQTASLGPSDLRVLVGRLKECDLRVRDPAVSRRHCEFLWRDGNVYVIDKGSSTGTWLNNERVREAQVWPGDTVRVGTSEIELRKEDAPEARGVAPSDVVWELTWDGETGSERLRLDARHKQVLVGRAKKCELRTANPTVSGTHCAFTFEGDELVVTDLDSSNGTFVNDKRVRRSQLADGDLLRCGHFEIRIGRISMAVDDGWYDDWDEEEEMGPPSWRLLFFADGRIDVMTLSQSERVAAVGTDEACEIWGDAEGLEGEHCEIEWDQGIIVAKDLGTEAGTLFNGERHDERLLRNGDIVSCGDFLLAAVRGAPEGAAPPTSEERSHEADKWAPSLERPDEELEIVYVEGGGSNREVLLWGDGFMRVDLIDADGEREKTKGGLTEQTVHLLCEVLLRGPVPDLPGEPDPDDASPGELLLYHGALETSLVLDRRMLDRSLAYRECVDILKALGDLVRRPD